MNEETVKNFVERMWLQWSRDNKYNLTYFYDDNWTAEGVNAFAIYCIVVFGFSGENR